MAKTYAKYPRKWLGLSGPQIEFCKLFATGQSATQSYLDAGLRCPTRGSGGSDRASAGKRAWELLKKPEIREQIREFRRRAVEVGQLDANAVLESLKHEALFPRTAIFDRKGGVKPPHKWPPEVDAFVSGFDVKESWPVQRAADGTIERDEQGRMIRVRVLKYKVRFQQSTTAKRILAEWLGLIGRRELSAADNPPLTTIVLEGGPEVDELRKQVFGDSPVSGG